LRPSRLPISAKVDLSGSDKRNRAPQLAPSFDYRSARQGGSVSHGHAEYG